MHGESREPAVFEPGDDGRTIMGRVAEGLWKVPSDLPEQGRRYDAQRLSGVAVELKSHLPIERQAPAIGAIWLDQQLIGGAGDWATSALAARSRKPCTNALASW